MISHLDPYNRSEVLVQFVIKSRRIASEELEVYLWICIMIIMLAAFSILVLKISLKSYAVA